MTDRWNIMGQVCNVVPLENVELEPWQVSRAHT